MRRAFLISIVLIIATSGVAGGGFRYIYGLGDDSTVISSASVEEILRVHKRYSGEYLWARLDGREYVIRDAAVFAEMRRALRPRQELAPERRAVRARMKPLEKRQQRLERQIDALSDRGEDVPAALEMQLEQVERELERYEREHNQLERRLDGLDRVIEGTIEKIIERAIRAGVAQRVR